VLIAKAESARLRGDLESASSFLHAAANLSPWRPGLREQAAASALVAGRPLEAIADIARVESPSLDAYVLLAAAHERTGNLEAALDVYLTSLQIYGPTTELYAGKAHIHRSRGEAQEESATLRQLLRLTPEDAAARYRLGLLEMISAPEAARSELAQAAVLAPDYRAAVDTLRAALDLAGLEEEPALRLVIVGRGLGLVGEWELAAPAFRQAVQAKETLAEAWAWLGEAKQHIGQDGLAELDRAMELDSSSAIVRGLFALYWARAGDHGRALAEYSAAADLEPEQPAWQISIGQAYAQLGDLSAALSAHQRASELAPEDPNVWRMLARFCAENGVFVEEVGLPAAQRAFELASGDLEVQDVLGWSYLSSGRLALAERTLLKVLERDPEHWFARVHLAMTYLAQGRAAAAQEQLRSIQAADADEEAVNAATRLLVQYFP
jgi:tetratricopeptide (TPR) repeat protein